MVTMDRSPNPNYLDDTLGNLSRSDLLASDRLTNLLLVDSEAGYPFAGHWDGTSDLKIQVLAVGSTVCANLNVARALQAGADIGEWVLFLEDDIDVCANFFDSVAKWLDRYGSRSPISIFGSVVANTTHEIAQVPLNKFYGTQAFAVRSHDALSISAYLEAHCYDLSENGVNYDLLISRWAREEYPDTTHFSVSCPSFVQHIGRSSVIEPRPVTHTFPSFQGHDWSYA